MLTTDARFSLRAMVTLANSVGPPDRLVTQAQLQDFYEEFGFSGPHAGSPGELDAVRALRDPVRSLLTADVKNAAAMANRWLRNTRAIPQLTKHDGQDWHVHAVPVQRSLTDRIRTEAAMAMFDLIRGDEMHRISVCEAAGCSKLVLDLTKNRSRRFCSTQ